MLRYESMKKPLTAQELLDLFAAAPAREQFGPNSDTPYICLLYTSPSPRD